MLNMKPLNLLVTACQFWLITCAYARSVVKDYHKAPRRWENVAPAPGDHVLNLRIGLVQGNFQELERQLYEVSDPRHVRYGQHLSSEEVNNLVRPQPEALRAVEEWLREAGIDSTVIRYNSAKTWVSFPVSVSVAEALLDTEYSVWEHEDGSTLVRTESWSLPEHLHEHITTIQPTNSWGRLQRRVPVHEIRSARSLAVRNKHFNPSWSSWSAASSSTPSPTPSPPPPAAPSSSPSSPIPAPLGIPGPLPAEIAALCNFSHVTPDCLRTLYGVASYEPASDGASQLGVCNYLAETNNRSDTYQFLSMYRPEAAAAAYTFPQISIAGGPVDNGTNHADDGIGYEGNLDAQYIIGVGYPLPLVTWSTGGDNPTFMPDLATPDNTDEPYLVWIDYILAQENIPQVISTSYDDDEQTLSLAYAQAVCNEFAQFGARGVTLLFSSGDDGVGTNGSCYSNADNTTFEFLPYFPSTCPYVTSIGGTTNFPETAMYALSEFTPGAIYSSGAGFSNYFGVPNYQRDTVGKYVAGLNGLYDGFYNKSGR